MELELTLVHRGEDESRYEGSYGVAEFTIYLHPYAPPMAEVGSGGRRWEVSVLYSRRRWLLVDWLVLLGIRDEAGCRATDNCPTEEAALEAGRQIATTIGRTKRWRRIPSWPQVHACYRNY